MGAVCKQPPGLGAEGQQRAGARDSGFGPGPPLSSPPAPGAALTFRAGGRGGGGGEGGGGERLLFLLFRALSRPSSALAGPGHGRGPQPGREGGSPGSALQPSLAPPRRDESASLRCSVLPPARRAVAAVAAALGKWRPSSFSLPPFNLKRRENGASERAGERRGHGEEGQQRLRRLRLRRRRAAPPRRAARGRPPRRPRGPPGGAAAAASVMAPRRGRCFCASICGGSGARPQLPRTCGDGTQHCGRREPALAAAKVRLT
ncbi:uncharacterized protein LOC116541681 [Sapajus apella]|uniref:Uncharacterized protein LOC116541681 n=1 Tax=Sapajus apella TaxID=9515 RepID=A0A6J3GWU2_SAPAP|nr:uncharacterized protein LOC116541681 [Sapajus apella]